MTTFFAGLDLGQAADFSALVIAEKFTPQRAEGKRMPDPVYQLRHLQRFPLGTAYPTIVQQVTNILEKPLLQGRTLLALDYTGVGRPVADMFTLSTLSCPITAVSIHGGDSVTWDGIHARVPKRDLVSVVQILLQSRRLQIANTLPEAKTLERELLNFRVKIDPATAHDSYSAWRENVHDDLVLAVALALWTAEHGLVAGVWGR